MTMVTSEALGRFLISLGWIRQTSRDGLLVRYQIENYGGLKGPVSIFLSTAGEDPREIELAMQSLREVYKFTDTDIRQGIVGLNYDRLMARVPDEYMRNESVELRAVRSYLNGMRSLIMSSATMEVTGKRFFSKSIKVAKEYADRCRFPHTFKGSFGLSIEAPIESIHQTHMDFSSEVAPFGRRVVRTLAIGLASVQKATQADDPTIIVDEDGGFNAGMCNDLIGILRQSGVPRIDVSIGLSPTVEASDFIETAFRLEARQISILEDAAARMSVPEPPREEEIVGRVVGLHSEVAPADFENLTGRRQVQISWISEDSKMFNVSMSLEPEQYLEAIEAHRNGEFVRARGLLRRERIRMLDDVSKFDRFR